MVFVLICQMYPFATASASMHPEEISQVNYIYTRPNSIDLFLGRLSREKLAGETKGAHPCMIIPV